MPSSNWMKRLALTPALIASVFLVTACAVSKPSASVGVHLPALPASATKCAAPVELPDAPLSQKDVERLWARDRAALVRCGYSLNTLVKYYEDLSQRLKAADARGAK